MSYRNFLDSENRRWEVWLVLPTAAERRKRERRVATATGSSAQYTGDERRKTPSRRLNPFHRQSLVQPGFENGWLCFESGEGEKRRLAPVPKSWETASSEQLQLWCRLGVRVMKCGP
jgi:hypothetical protein